MDIDVLIRGDLEEFRKKLVEYLEEEDTPYDLKGDKTVMNTACTHGHLHIVKYLINSGCNANYHDADGCTALHLASKMGHAHIVRFLAGTFRFLQRGINISAFNYNRATPLHLACFYGHSKVVRELVNSELCDLIASDREGNTPLHVACISVAFECVKVLVNLEANILDHPNQKTGDTPLHAAAHHGHIGIVQCILHSSKRSNILVPNHSGKTPLDIAISQKHSDISYLFLDEVQSDENLFQQLPAYSTLLHHDYKPLLRSNVALTDCGCGVNAPNRGGDTPLHTACLHGHAEEVKRLIQSKQCNLNASNKNGDTPLHVACFEGETDCVQLLVSKTDCDLSHRNKQGDTPLHIACLQGAFECAQILFSSQDININDYQNNEQWTLQHTSVVGGHFNSQWHQLFACASWNLSTPNQYGETLLHVAVHYGHLRVVKYILCQVGSSALLQCLNSGDTLLHVACQANHVEIVRYIVNECATLSMDLIKDRMKVTALATAVECKHWECVQIIAESGHCNLNEPDFKGNTFLHRAVESNDFEEVNILLSNHLCDPTLRNMKGETPLSIALKKHSFSLAIAILTSTDHYNVNSPDSDDNTLLHHAVIANDAKLISKILQNDSCDPNTVNKAGETPLHICCRQITSTDTICRMLVEDQRCNPNVTDRSGNTALHSAIKSLRQSYIRLLIDRKCDPSIRNTDGDTPLHIACRKGSKHGNQGKTIVKLLLYTGKVDSDCVNNAGATPIELVGTNYLIIQEITHFIETKVKHPVETYVKLLVLGNASTGKSTLIKAICTEASKLVKFAPKKYKHVQGVQRRTAGIIPIPFRSKHFGNAVLYDFAGQHEYYSSHAAVLENLVLPTPPAFVVVVDMSEPIDQVLGKLTYWWSFIDNHSQKTSTPPHVILAASHSDVVKARGEKPIEVMKVIMNALDVIPATFNFIGHAYLDCRKLISHGLTNILLMLNKTCLTLRSNANIDFRCHVLTAFLSEKFHKEVACTISKIISQVQDEDSLLPQDASEMVQLLSTLNDKGQVVLLNKLTSVNIKDSWVVLQREVLLKEVNGSVFSPETFKQHCKDFARSTGVVPLSKIKERFPHYHPDMITGFLSHLEFCFKIEDYRALEVITNDWNPRSPSAIKEEEEFYFFPALVRVEHPSLGEVWNPDPKVTFQCGWLYRCSFDYQFLTTRCLHVLILRLAFSFALGIDRRPLDQIPVIHRRCSAWKRGIAWWNMDGIETVVEVGLQHQWIVVMVRCSNGQEVACAQLRSSVIKTVMDTKVEFCPALSMSESLISPSALHYPLMSGQEFTLYRMKDVATALVTAKPFVLDESGTKPAELTNLLPFQPYNGFGETLLRKIFDTEYSNKEVSNKDLSDIADKAYSQLDLFEQALKPMQSRFQERCSRALNTTEITKCIYLLEIVRERGSGTFRELEQELSKFSIFCGKSPLVSLKSFHC